jgi:hypothetical protein
MNRNQVKLALAYISLLLLIGGWGVVIVRQ